MRLTPRACGLTRDGRDHHRICAGEDGEGGDASGDADVGRVAILVQLANALTRRHQAEDRAHALDIMLKEVVCHPRHTVPDNVGLVGRIYKDIFAESKHTDTAALDQAIRWYKKAMEIEEGFYPAINLATLLYVRGERIPQSQLLADIHIKLVWFLGRHGDMAEVTNFWTVATIFEMHVLFERYDLAVVAAFHMFALKVRGGGKAKGAAEEREEYDGEGRKVGEGGEEDREDREDNFPAAS